MAGFLRVLQLLLDHPWSVRPLVLDPASEVSPEDRRAMVQVRSDSCSDLLSSWHTRYLLLLAVLGDGGPDSAVVRLMVNLQPQLIAVLQVAMQACDDSMRHTYCVAAAPQQDHLFLLLGAHAVIHPQCYHLPSAGIRCSHGGGQRAGDVAGGAVQRHSLGAVGGPQPDAGSPAALARLRPPLRRCIAGMRYTRDIYTLPLAARSASA